MVVDYTKRDKTKPRKVRLPRNKVGRGTNDNNVQNKADEVSSSKNPLTKNNKKKAIKKMVFAEIFLAFACFIGYQVLKQITDGDISSFKLEELAANQIIPLLFISLFIFVGLKMLFKALKGIIS